MAVGFGLLIGSFILGRRPGNPIGLLLVVIALGACCQYFFESYWAAHGAPLSDPSNAAIWALKISGASATIGFSGMLVFLPVLFPDGRPHTRWTRWLVVITAVFASLQAGSILLSGQSLCVLEPADSSRCLRMIEDPPGIPWLPSAAESPLEYVFGPLIMLSIAAGLVAAVSRFRRSAGEVRAQMKWFALGALASVLIIPPAIVLNSAFGVVYPDWIFNFPFILMPLGVGIAVLRYRLYDIDRIVSRTVTYALVVTILGLAVSGVAAIVGAQFEEPWVVAAATLAVAGAFNPLRRRVQGWVDRRFNRSRYDMERVMEGFVGSLQGRVDPIGVVNAWVEVVGETMQPTLLAVWVRERATPPSTG